MAVAKLSVKPAPHGVAGGSQLRGFYVLYGTTVGVLLPFLPAFLRTFELTASQIGVLLAVQPVFTVAAPPGWGYWADRTGRADRLLTLASAGTMAGFSLVLRANTFTGFLGALSVYAFFASAVTTLLDTLTLQRIAAHGGVYARFRLFSSLGFVLGALAFGNFARRVDARALAFVGALIAGYVLWSLTLRARGAARPINPVRHMGEALAEPGFVRLLLVCMLHWIAGTPYLGLFALHLQARGLGTRFFGASFALGVVAEVVAMFLYPRVRRRRSERWVLGVALVVSVARWLGTAFALTGPALLALCALHGITSGAFLVAAVQYLAERAPPHQRATRQALYVAATVGAGGVIGMPLSGWAFQAFGGQTLFLGAAALELATLALFARTTRAG